MLSALFSRLATLSPFLRRSGASFALRFAGLALQLGASILIARVLGVEGFGVYSYAFVVALLIATLHGAGFGFLAVRELPVYLVRREFGHVRGYLRTWGGLLAISTALSVVAVLGLTAAGVLHLQIAWPLVLLAAIAQALILGMSAVLNGLQRVIHSQFIETVLRQGLFVALLLGLVASGLVMTPTTVFALSLAVSGAVLLCLLWYVRRCLAAETGPVLPPPAYATRPWVLAGVSLMAIGILNLLQTSLDILMLGALADHADLGRYRAASRGVDTIIIANGIALQLLEPILARAIGQKDTAGAQAMISSSVMVSVALSAAIALPLGFGASIYLGLFGPDFVAAAPVMQILVLGNMLAFLCGPVAVILVMQGHERLVLGTAICTLALNAGLNLLLIPLWGILGAATATATSVVVFKLALLVAVRMLTPFDPTLWTPLRQRLRSWRG